MQETLRCPGCQAELTLTASDARSGQCPRCRSVLDLTPAAGNTALTAASPLPTARYLHTKADLDDDMPDDLRTLVRPDPLTGEWRAILAAFVLTFSVFSYGLQAYHAYERGRWLRQEQHVLFHAPAPFPDTGLAAVVHEAVYWPAMICFLVWLYQASRNLKLLQSAGMSHTPAAAVVSFFVPFMNLYRPYFIMQEIWRGSDARAAGSSLAWLDAPRAGAIRFWWLFFLAAHLIGFISRQLDYATSW